MSFSNRPLAAPGIPHMSAATMSSGMSRSFRQGSTTINSRAQMYPRSITPPPTTDGPTITVFVGNISERASEHMIKKILSSVGYVLNWKRVSTFGFCDYDGPLAGSRAVRLLHELEVDGKRLVAKVDAKNKLLLDNYQETSGTARDGATEQRDDDTIMARISRILNDHREEMESFQVASDKEQSSNKQAKVLKDTDLEEDKRDIIHREIGKFRKFAEEEEQKKEREKDRRKRDEKVLRSTSPMAEPVVIERKKERRRSRSTDRFEREREDRDRERERERIREDLSAPKTVRNVHRQKEMDEELRDRKKREKKTREMEAAYQERLRIWELRERRKAKDYERENERERCRDEEREREAKRLKEFLEDYEDERDDPKYYKGKELQRRLSERLREADADAKDRAKEQDELEELKTKIFTGEFSNPAEEFERQKQERENFYKPRPLIHVNVGKSQPRHPEQLRDIEFEEKRRPQAMHQERQRKDSHAKTIAGARREFASVDAEPIDSDSSEGAYPASKYAVPGQDVRKFEIEGNLASASPSNTVEGGSSHTATISLNLGAISTKKKRLEVKDVFSIDEETEDLSGAKKRKLVPLDYDDKLHPSGLAMDSANGNAADPASVTHRRSAESQEERRKQIKSIIDKIPTEKADLFAFQLEWNAIDQSLMEKKIRPWINKKIIEYIGEPEPTLVDFICSKVMAGSTPAGILDDVQMVLDEEAEVFVVKMWRLLIYEVEAKKLGLSNK